MYFIVCNAFVVGGLKTLALSMAKALSSKGKRVSLVCYYLDEEAEDMCARNSIGIVQVKKWTVSALCKSILNSSDEIECVQFLEFRDYLAFQLANNKKIKSMHYCVNPEGLQLLENVKILRRLIKKELASLIVSLSKNNSIVYMDENVLINNLLFYDIRIKKEDYTFIPLPFNQSDYLPTKKTNDSFSILAVARAAFPFKGYLIGLIERINQYYKELFPFTLTIISTGQNIDVLKEKINSVDKELKTHIRFIEGVSLQELNNYYKAADLFIGMGMTVLSAADYGIPTIVVQHDTYEFISQGFFHENPSNLGSTYLDGHDGIEDIKRIMEVDSKEYYGIKRLTKKQLDYYDSKRIADALIELDYQSIIKFPIKTKLFLKMYFRIKELLHGSI